MAAGLGIPRDPAARPTRREPRRRLPQSRCVPNPRLHPAPRGLPGHSARRDKRVPTTSGTGHHATADRRRRTSRHGWNPRACFRTTTTRRWLRAARDLLGWCAARFDAVGGYALHVADDSVTAAFGTPLLAVEFVRQLAITAQLGRFDDRQQCLGDHHGGADGTVGGHFDAAGRAARSPLRPAGDEHLVPRPGDGRQPRWPYVHPLQRRRRLLHLTALGIDGF